MERDLFERNIIHDWSFGTAVHQVDHLSDVHRLSDRGRRISAGTYHDQGHQPRHRRRVHRRFAVRLLLLFFPRSEPGGRRRHLREGGIEDRRECRTGPVRLLGRVHRRAQFLPKPQKELQVLCQSGTHHHPRRRPCDRRCHLHRRTVLERRPRVVQSPGGRSPVRRPHLYPGVLRRQRVGRCRP